MYPFDIKISYKQSRCRETWLNRIYLGPTFVLRIDRWSVFYRFK